MTNSDHARARFITLVHELDQIEKKPDPGAVQYNAGVDRLRDFVRSWSRDEVTEILTPLLTAEPPIRGTAAGFLLNMGIATDDALTVLRELASKVDEYEQAAFDAGDVLMVWEREQHK